MLLEIFRLLKAMHQKLKVDAGSLLTHTQKFAHKGTDSFIDILYALIERFYDINKAHNEVTTTFYHSFAI
jgi:hypothetical protein